MFRFGRESGISSTHAYSRWSSASSMAAMVSLFAERALGFGTVEGGSSANRLRLVGSQASAGIRVWHTLACDFAELESSTG